MRKSFYFNIFIGCFFFSLSAFSQDTVMPEQMQENSSIYIVPPEGFGRTVYLKGFHNQITGSRIRGGELPITSYGQYAYPFTDMKAAYHYYKDKNYEVSSIDTIVLAGQEVKLMTGVVKFQGTDIQVYQTLVKGDNLVTLSYEIHEGDQTGREDVIASMKTLSLKTQNVLSVFDDLEFIFETVAPFNNVVSNYGMGILSTFYGTDRKENKPAIAISLTNRNVTYQRPTERSLTVKERAIYHAIEYLSQDAGYDRSKRELVFEGFEKISDGQAYKVIVTHKNKMIIVYLCPLPDGRDLKILAYGAQKELEPLRKSVQAIANTVKMK